MSSKGVGRKRMMRVLEALCVVICAGLGFGPQVQASEDDLSWSNVSACTDAMRVGLYLEAFPEGRHVADARVCLERLGVEVTAKAIIDPKKHIEVRIAGPFFSPEGKESLIIKAIPSDFKLSFSKDEGSWRWLVETPLGAVNHFHGTLEFYRGDLLLGIVDHGAETNSLEGLCHSLMTSQIELLVRSWNGGATDPGSTSLVYYNTHTGAIGLKGGGENNRRIHADAIF